MYRELFHIPATSMGHADPHHVIGEISEALDGTAYNMLYDVPEDEYLLVEWVEDDD